jgi:hypothetical protein
MKKLAMITIMALFAMFATSCKEYQEDKYEEISNSETAFMIPLEAGSKAGGKLSPAEYDQHKVMAKKIQIPTRWHQTGRMPWSGKWVDTVKVIVVDRAPVNGNWQGTQAITVESQDSIDFTLSFNCTAEIDDNDASLYLFRYPAKDLSSVVNTEVRNMVQQTVSSVSARFGMDELRSQKLEITTVVRETVIPHFKERGITISTLGMSSGFNYSNSKIQESLDAIVVLQQLKVEEKAKLSAMGDQILRREAEAQAEADYKVKIAEGDALKSVIEREALAKTLLIDTRANSEALLIEAKSKADAKVVTAMGDATAIKEKIDALTASGKSFDYLKLKEIEVELAKVQKWQGGVPMITGGDSPTQFMDVSDFVGSKKTLK